MLNNGILGKKTLKIFIRQLVTPTCLNVKPNLRRFLLTVDKQYCEPVECWISQRSSSNVIEGSFSAASTNTNCSWTWRLEILGLPTLKHCTSPVSKNFLRIRFTVLLCISNRQAIRLLLKRHWYLRLITRQRKSLLYIAIWNLVQPQWVDNFLVSQRFLFVNAVVRFRKFNARNIS